MSIREKFLTQANAVEYRIQRSQYLEMAIVGNYEQLFCNERDIIRQEQLFIFAAEYPDSMLESKGRYFFVATIDEAWKIMQDTPKQKRHFYELIEDGCACHPYFDLECHTDDAPPVEKVVEAFIDAINSSGILPIDHSGERVQLVGSDIVVLRSLPMVEQKFSLHMIVHLPADRYREECLMFPDNAALGRWVKDSIHPFVQASLQRRTSLIDMSVYSRNRTFRTAGSTKKSKESYFIPYIWKTMRHEKEKKHCGMTAEPLYSKEMFSRSLITNISNCKILPHASMCTFLPGGVSTVFKIQESQKTTGMSTKTPGSWKSFHPAIDAYVRENIDDYRNVFHYKDSTSVCYALKSLKYCGNVGREHKSNGIYIVVDLHNWTVHQRCFDYECKSYRGPATHLPASVRDAYQAQSEASA
ncbi:DNA primase [Perkinsela sp. CCAP 1560/4]|nr:DNA primase [Perkinsela sp. CCAP 1560/4]|eukprot:KNH07858.1 DNA primase [Perkinsela sp. CCAP 1560/4]